MKKSYKPCNLRLPLQVAGLFLFPQLLALKKDSTSSIHVSPANVNGFIQKIDSKGRPTKILYNPKTGNKASSTNPKTWADFDFAALAFEQHDYSGLGFVFTKEGGIVGVDIDHCIDPDTGALNKTAAAILEKLPPTYIEISPSGTGLHIFLRGAMPEGDSRNAKTGVEMYSHGC